MKILILGMGHIGKALATTLRQQGHVVTGTTTTPAKVESLQQCADEIIVLQGSDRDAVIDAARSVDYVIITVAPNVKNTKTIEERHQHYQQTLLETCRNVADSETPSLFCSSFSVYGDGTQVEQDITEDSPTANHEEPSSKYYQLAEAEVLRHEKGCVLRFPDMYGAPGDMSFSERVKMAHEFFGGKILFGREALLYSIHFEDVVQAILHALEKQLNGIYNVCDNLSLPGTNAEVFDAICREQGLSDLEYTNHIKAPSQRISADKLYASGYSVQHSDPNSVYRQVHS
ncbi:NAD-dependent epimerase/dehydratase family protein [Aestuariicella hydrocarbonica]|uniref:NAD-dependent epimerase/dehydratase family protein n=1 Tax=Pseudomaricurvus hydrocarbonicus TaxID=1470433 RepID=A0A9E5T3M9_9GAMM|nr:NAD-dependent epimerase/dehydratase family protein [Aestuariicella hydrocarbonica]NHO67277.1 NAD-dependent epimerase/dehydratase family protein [Aestuariicella hydrocarbonica]